MENRTAIWWLLIVGVLVAGGIASYFQRDRFETNSEAAPDIPEAVATLVAVGDCPWGEASCILAQGIERALQRGNVDAVMEFGAPQFYVCSGGNQGPLPLCQGSGPDEGKRGYPTRSRPDAEMVVSEADARGNHERFVDTVRPNARDEVGTGAIRLYAFACDELAVRVQPVSCAHVGIVLSAIVGDGPEQHREVLVFWAVGGFAGRSLPFTEVWDGAVRAEEVPVLFEDGGELADFGDVHVIDQSLR